MTTQSSTNYWDKQFMWNRVGSDPGILVIRFLTGKIKNSGCFSASSSSGDQTVIAISRVCKKWRENRMLQLMRENAIERIHSRVTIQDVLRGAMIEIGTRGFSRGYNFSLCRFFRQMGLPVGKIPVIPQEILGNNGMVRTNLQNWFREHPIGRTICSGNCCPNAIIVRVRLKDNAPNEEMKNRSIILCIDQHGAICPLETLPLYDEGFDQNTDLWRAVNSEIMNQYHFNLPQIDMWIAELQNPSSYLTLDPACKNTLVQPPQVPTQSQPQYIPALSTTNRTMSPDRMAFAITALTFLANYMWHSRFSF